MQRFASTGEEKPNKVRLVYPALSGRGFFCSIKMLSDSGNKTQKEDIAMNKNKITNVCFSEEGISRDFQFFDYAVQHKDWTGANGILYCIYKGEKYAEIVLKNVKDFEHMELMSNKILYVESVSMRKEKCRQYIISYQNTLLSTKIFAEEMTMYPSSYLIREASRYAIAEWKKQNICLPSLMTALLMLKNEGSSISSEHIREQVREYINVFTEWRASAEANETQMYQWSQEYYVLAVQSILEALAPLYRQNNLDTVLIHKIEKNNLMRFDPYLL